MCAKIFYDETSEMKEIRLESYISKCIFFYKDWKITVLRSFGHLEWVFGKPFGIVYKTD